jgi:hypothetical protein
MLIFSYFITPYAASIIVDIFITLMLPPTARHSLFILRFCCCQRHAAPPDYFICCQMPRRRDTLSVSPPLFSPPPGLPPPSFTRFAFEVSRFRRYADAPPHITPRWPDIFDAITTFSPVLFDISCHAIIFFHAIT